MVQFLSPDFQIKNTTEQKPTMEILNLKQISFWNYQYTSRST